MSINVNGVTLPDIPVVEGYPYATVITVEESGETVKAVFLAAVSEILYIPPELNGTEFGLITHMTPGDIVYEWTPATNEWQLYAESTDVQQNYPCGNVDGTDYSITWANHNIAVVGLGTDGAPYATDEIYFPSSVVAEPEYGKIRRQIVRGIADAIRRKTGGTDKIPPEQMESEIDSIVTADGLPNAESFEFGALDEGDGVEYGITGTYSSMCYTKGEIGTQFKAASGFSILGLRGYKSWRGKTVKVWDSTGTLIESAVIPKTGSSSSVWETVYFANPITIVPNEVFTISGYTDADSNGLRTQESSFNSKIVSANGVYGSNKDVCPTTKLQDNYGWDLAPMIDIVIGPAEATERPETLQITIDSLDELANEVKRVTSASGRLSITEMKSALKSL